MVTVVREEEELGPANPAKCAVGRREVQYLGYHLLEGGRQVRPQMNKTAAIAACPPPKTKKEVRRFLGLAGFYRRFIPRFLDLTSPLTDLTRKVAPELVQWSEQCQRVFEKVKKALCEEPVLCMPNFAILLSAGRRVGQGAGGGTVPASGGRRPPRPVHQPKTLGPEGEVQHGREGVPRHPVGGRGPSVLPVGARLQPLLGPQTAPTAPPHEGCQCEDHPAVPRVATLQLPGGPQTGGPDGRGKPPPPPVEGRERKSARRDGCRPETGGGGMFEGACSTRRLWAGHVQEPAVKQMTALVTAEGELKI
nr:uncharacterized protein LOC133619518 [Nerophis lumbriciformis]